MAEAQANVQAAHAVPPPAGRAKPVCTQAGNTSLVLRTCRADMTSSNGFVWPQAGGIAQAPDWNDLPECGQGLHGWLYGHGDYRCSNYRNSTAKWLVVEVESDSIVMLKGKCKFARGKVLFVGSKKDATDYLRTHEPRAREGAVIGAQIIAGDHEIATVGDYGTATAGYMGTATAGDYGTATAGYMGTATAGGGGTATVGDYGMATAGDYGRATAGDEGTATVGDEGTATAGVKGRIHISYWDKSANRDRTKTGYIGEDGLLPKMAYRLDERHQFVEAM